MAMQSSGSKGGYKRDEGLMMIRTGLSRIEGYHSDGSDIEGKVTGETGENVVGYGSEADVEDNVDEDSIKTL